MHTYDFIQKHGRVKMKPKNDKMLKLLLYSGLVEHSSIVVGRPLGFLTYTENHNKNLMLEKVK